MRTSTLLAVIIAGALALATPASAQISSGATVSHGLTQTIPYLNPCTGATGELTITYTVTANGVNEDGPPFFHFTQTVVGDFSLDDGTTGHFTTHTAIEANGDGGVIPSTTEAHGTTADGAQFSLHFVSLSNDEPPQVTLSFEHCA